MTQGIWKRHLYLYIAIFLAIAIGWLAHSVYLDFAAQAEQNPALPGSNGVLAKVNNIFTFSSAEILSPQDHISEDQISVYDDHVELRIDDPVWSSFTDTNSMDPLLDVGANGIEIVPKSAQDIHVGDVISYKTAKGVVIHRVIGIGADEEGIYYTVKGDNNPIEDRVKVRFSDVQGILVAVVY